MPVSKFASLISCSAITRSLFYCRLLSILSTEAASRHHPMITSLLELQLQKKILVSIVWGIIVYPPTQHKASQFSQWCSLRGKVPLYTLTQRKKMKKPQERKHKVRSSLFECCRGQWVMIGAVSYHVLMSFCSPLLLCEHGTYLWD